MPFDQIEISLNFCILVHFVEDSEDASQQKEETPADHPAACIPASTPVKLQEGMTGRAKGARSCRSTCFHASVNNISLGLMGEKTLFFIW